MPNWIDTFVQEAEDLLAEVEQCALSLTEAEDSGEAINKLFRSFHTIKGSSGMCGLDGIAAFTHHVETLLDKVRAGKLGVSPALVDVVLASRDHIVAMIGAERGGEQVAGERTEELITLLRAVAGVAVETAERREDVEPKKVVAAGKERRWHIHFRPSADMLTCGGNPQLLFRDLREQGKCTITAQVDAIPPLSDILPNVCYMAWDIELVTAADRNAIRDLFIFVEDGSELTIEPAESHAGVVPSPEAGVKSPKAGAVATKAVESKVAKESSVRVPSERLDRLVNLVGELVMNQSRLAQASAQVGAPELASPVEEIERLVSELRDNVLSIRMLPIGTLFGRFRRLVHDLSAELNKEVELITEGADTELDKSILDQLGEPLVHLLRNCVDHGMETAEERQAAGKAKRGTITLAAVHTGSDVVVSIEDDGRGIDRAKVRAKAVEKQLISADTTLSDKELLNLILLPGFSTAKQVTNVSGRGVGMDVVKRQIDAMRGALAIESKEGEGTKVSLSLPLTLAIIDGLLVQVGRDQFIIPMSAVTENVDLEQAQRNRNNGRNVVPVRGELVPYVDLRSTFEIGGTPPAIEKIVLVRHEDNRVGLVVDRVLGTHQTVLQSLGHFFRGIKVVSGATIMGDGRVALIFDIPAIVGFANREAATHLSAH